MKILLSFALLGILAAGLTQTAQAQARRVQPRGRVQPKPRLNPSATPESKDGMVLQNGRVQLTEQAITNPLTEDKKLLNGVTVTTSGEVVRPDGSKTQLAEGDYVSLTGRITTKREMVEADSVRKLVQYDLKHPGKRKELEKAREKAEKAKEKADRERAKEQAKAARG